MVLPLRVIYNIISRTIPVAITKTLYLNIKSKEKDIIYVTLAVHLVFHIATYVKLAFDNLLFVSKLDKVYITLINNHPTKVVIVK